MKLIIALIENLHGQLDGALKGLLELCLSELSFLGPKVSKHYQAMVMQVFCMSFWYNSGLTFNLLFEIDKTGGAIFTVFQRLLNCIPGMSLDFELRRAIFGLTAIVNTDPSTMPGPVSDRLPDIVQWIA